MRLQSLSATVLGLTLLVTPSILPVFAQEQVNPTTSQQEITPSTPETTSPEESAEPTTSQEEATPSTEEDDTPSYDQQPEISTPDQEDDTQTQEQGGTRATASSKIDYSRVQPTPAKKSINQGVTSPSPRYMKQVLGVPGALTKNCSPLQNSRLKKLMVTQDVGPFKVTGLKPTVGVLKRVFSKVKKDNPQLYSQLGTAGMLCVRKVRGGSNFSNHSWGTAIDIKINRKLDKRGDNKTQRGLKALYPYFHKEKFYWGAEFPTEDSMHFEASKELISQWKREGKI